jgi:2-polyprenyl-6-methoxyphenol hydroxylase-like FAD-dependent oxidoreductase
VYLNREVVIELPLEPAAFGGHAPTAVSQSALLEAIVAEAARRPGFRLLRGAAVRELLAEGGRVTGVRVQTDGGAQELRGDLVVGADGRASLVRRRGGFEARQNAPPMDIVWCKLPPLPGFRGARGYAGGGHLLLAYHTFGDQLQVGWAIVKKSFGELRRRGVEQWVEEMARHVTADLAAHLRAHAGAVRHPFVLDVVSDRVTVWSAPGVLLLGDAAHTMSPVGGQGLNVALRDSIAAANQLVPVLRATAGAAAIDEAARRVESLRRPEIEALQRMQAIAPRLVLTHRWWGEPVRRTLRQLLRSPFARRRAAAALRPFAFGTTPLTLDV